MYVTVYIVYTHCYIQYIFLCHVSFFIVFCVFYCAFILLFSFYGYYLINICCWIVDAVQLAIIGIIMSSICNTAEVPVSLPTIPFDRDSSCLRYKPSFTFHWQWGCLRSDPIRFECSCWHCRSPAFNECYAWTFRDLRTGIQLVRIRILHLWSVTGSRR